MMTDKMLDFIISSVRAEETEKRRAQDEQDRKNRECAIKAGSFTVDRPAGDLIGPCQTKMEYHQSRVKFYGEKLGEAEKELRENGIKMEMIDPVTGTRQVVSYTPPTNVILSGNIGSGSVGHFHGSSGCVSSGGLSWNNAYQNSYNQPNALFQPRIDPVMLEAVNSARSKMQEHQTKAIQYSKYAAAFSLDPVRKINLGIEDVHYFGLGQPCIMTSGVQQT